jgi:predicted HicB family RNase H-like nuclease
VAAAIAGSSETSVHTYQTTCNYSPEADIFKGKVVPVQKYHAINKYAGVKV